MYSEFMNNIFDRAQKFKNELGEDEGFEVMKGDDLMYEDEYDDTMEYMTEPK